jgi:hypothetical protein
MTGWIAASALVGVLAALHGGLMAGSGLGRSLGRATRATAGAHTLIHTLARVLSTLDGRFMGGLIVLCHIAFLLISASALRARATLLIED